MEGIEDEIGQDTPMKQTTEAMQTFLEMRVLHTLEMCFWQRSFFLNWFFNGFFVYLIFVLGLSNSGILELKTSIYTFGMIPYTFT